MKLENIHPAKREKIRQKGLMPYIIANNDNYLTMCLIMVQFPDSAVISQKTPRGDTRCVSWKDFCKYIAGRLGLPIECIGNNIEMIYHADKMREIGNILEEIEIG